MSFTSNSSGGEYFHALTKDEMPSHGHVMALYSTASNLGEQVSVEPWSTAVTTMYKNSNNDSFYRIAKNNTYQGTFAYENGGNQKHNNIQPYIVVYFWRRIA